MKKQLLAFLAACCFATIVQADPHCDDLPSGQEIQAQCLCNFSGSPNWCQGRTKNANQCPSGSSLVNNKCEISVSPVQCEQQCQTVEGQCVNARTDPAKCQAAYTACVNACNKK